MSWFPPQKQILLRNGRVVTVLADHGVFVEVYAGADLGKYAVGRQEIAPLQINPMLMNYVRVRRYLPEFEVHVNMAGHLAGVWKRDGTHYAMVYPYEYETRPTINNLRLLLAWLVMECRQRTIGALEKRCREGGKFFSS